MVGLGAPPPQSRWVPPTVVHPSAPSCKSPPRAGCVSLCASPNAAASPRRRHGLSSQLVIRDLDLVMPAHARGGGAPAAPRRGLWPLWPRARSACPRGSCPGLFLSRRSPREAHPRPPSVTATSAALVADALRQPPSPTHQLSRRLLRRRRVPPPGPCATGGPAGRRGPTWADGGGAGAGRGHPPHHRHVGCPYTHCRYAWPAETIATA